MLAITVISSIHVVIVKMDWKYPFSIPWTKDVTFWPLIPLYLVDKNSVHGLSFDPSECWASYCIPGIGYFTHVDVLTLVAKMWGEKERCFFTLFSLFSLLSPLTTHQHPSPIINHQNIESIHHPSPIIIRSHCISIPCPRMHLKKQTKNMPMLAR